MVRMQRVLRRVSLELAPARSGPPERARRFAAGVALALCLSAPGLHARQIPVGEAPGEMPPAVEPVLGPHDPVEIETFVDGYMAAHLGQQHVAGGVVAVVRLPPAAAAEDVDDPLRGSVAESAARDEEAEEGEAESAAATSGAPPELLFAKGYGWADVTARRPVTPDTLFRIGSVSKLFVWLSVMQQVEQGQLDLDGDVNVYLPDFQVPPAFGQPVTLTHLLTHTPGFEDHVVGLFARDESALRPIGELLRDEMPKRIWPPGETAAYSNHGTALAMYAVERVTGESWSRYVETEILKPVGLGSTSFAQPLPPALAERMAKGYQWSGSGFEERGFEYVPLAPVGAASSSANDMARFLVAFLRGGETRSGRRMLGEATMGRMESTLFQHAPGLQGMAHGLIDMSHAGVRALGHGGDTLWFHTVFAFFPDHGFGLFASFNTDTADTGSFYSAFVEHYFPPAEGEPPPAQGFGDAERFAGNYRTNRFDRTDLGKLAALMGSFEIAAQEDGSLVTRTGEWTRWVREGPLRFREEHGTRRLVFRENERGRVTHAFQSDLPILAFERVPLTERPALHRTLLTACLLLFALVVLGYPALALVRRAYGVVLPEPRKLPTVGRAFAWAASACYMGFLVSMLVALSDPLELVFGVPALLDGALWVPVLGAVFSLGALLFAISAWRRSRGGFVGRVFFSLVVLAGFVFLWQLWVWNLLGPRM